MKKWLLTLLAAAWLYATSWATFELEMPDWLELPTLYLVWLAWVACVAAAVYAWVMPRA